MAALILIDRDVLPEVRIPDVDRVAAYLDACPALLVASAKEPDRFDPTAGTVVPVGTATDGTFAFPLSTAYYVRTYGFAPDPALLEHVRSGTPPPDLAPEDLDRMRDEILAASRDEVLDEGLATGGDDGASPWDEGFWSDAGPGQTDPA